MHIYLIRHADAVAMGEPGVSTEEGRPLSDSGVAQAQSLGAAFRRLGIGLERILTSPLLRAKQTAERLLGQLQLTPGTLQECEQLAPGGSSKKLAKFLRELSVEKIALVGHEPDMSSHAAWLIGSKKAQIAFAKGAVAGIACESAPDKGNGVLEWLVTPEWFER